MRILTHSSFSWLNACPLAPPSGNLVARLKELPDHLRVNRRGLVSNGSTQRALDFWPGGDRIHKVHNGHMITHSPQTIAAQARGSAAGVTRSNSKAETLLCRSPQTSPSSRSDGTQAARVGTWSCLSVLYRIKPHYETAGRRSSHA